MIKNQPKDSAWPPLEVQDLRERNDGVRPRATPGRFSTLRDALAKVVKSR